MTDASRRAIPWFVAGLSLFTLCCAASSGARAVDPLEDAIARSSVIVNHAIDRGHEAEEEQELIRFRVRFNPVDCTCPAWEIVYLAVLPEQRGKGYGQELVARALRTAARSGVCTTLVAVDEANAPAIGLYRRVGFQTHLKTVAFVSFSDDPPAGTEA